MYSAIDLENWVQAFWTLARKELMISVNGDDLEHTILDSLTAISKTFSSPSAVSDNATFLKVFREILNGNNCLGNSAGVVITLQIFSNTECKGHLCEPERRLMNPSLNILLALCAGNEGACLVINDEVIRLLILLKSINTIHFFHHSRFPLCWSSINFVKTQFHASSF